MSSHIFSFFKPETIEQLELVNGKLAAVTAHNLQEANVTMDDMSDMAKVVIRAIEREVAARNYNPVIRSMMEVQIATFFIHGFLNNIMANSENVGEPAETEQ